MLTHSARRGLRIAIAAALWMGSPSLASGNPQLPTLQRYPTASATRLAFVAHGDLWIAPREGGRARRLVRSTGFMLTPRFSPDGRWIAYTERAGGGQDVYAVASGGGTPVRLTHDALPSPAGNLVVGWTPDGTHILFLSTRSSVASRQVQTFSVPLTGGLAERLPLDQSGRVDVSPADGRIAFTRTFTDLAARKRYVGGEAEDVFILDPRNGGLRRLTDWKGTDTAPMWSGDGLYFLSDRGAGFRLNLWHYDLTTGKLRQITHFADGDIDWPSLGGGRIVFQEGGCLWSLELRDERLHRLALNVADDGARTAPRLASVGGEARVADVTGERDFASTPDGRTGVLAAHGDLFRVAASDGSALDLTGTPGIQEEHPAVSPDGAVVAYVTEDRSGQQIAMRPMSGGSERRLTRFANAVLYTPVFSSDGDWLSVADANHRLWLISAATGHAELVAHDAVSEIRDAVFSSDGHWLAYSTTRQNGLSALHLRELATRRDVVVSNDSDGDRLPAFSADGSRLYFVSQRREFAATGDRGDEASIVSTSSDGIYVAPLDGGVDGLMARAIPLPTPPGRIGKVDVRGDALFYELRGSPIVGGELPGTAVTLHRIGQAGDTVVLADFDQQLVSADGSHVLFHRSDGWRSLAFGGAELILDLSHLIMRVDPRAEWRAMVDRAWRLDRDVFFNPAMNGSNWDAVRGAYAKLSRRIGSRDDFLYVLGQMQGELATSHAFIGGLDGGASGTVEATPRLGADLALDRTSGLYRFAHVFVGDPSRERFRAPLNDPARDVSVRAGETLLAIDGEALRAPTDPDALLLGKGATVRLTVGDSAGQHRRVLEVAPLPSDLDLRQHDWAEGNRGRVASLSAGRVGYIFVPDFNRKGAEDFIRQWQSQVGKSGLVIDVRWNTGGNLSQAILGLLRRPRAGSFVNREGGLEPLPLLPSPAVMAVVANAQSHSDGDQFPYFFRQFGLGPVIGQRTWGGVQGIRGPWPLMDGTTITIPKDSLATVDGQWIIENHGTEPDVAIDPAIDEPVTGNDAVLDGAVQVVMKRLEGKPAEPARRPRTLPAYPPAGDVPGAFSDRR